MFRWFGLGLLFLALLTACAGSAPEQSGTGRQDAAPVVTVYKAPT